MEYNNHNCNDDRVCDILERLEQTDDVYTILDKLCNLPSLLSLPELDEKYIEDVKLKLKELIQNNCGELNTHKNRMKRLIDLILFLTYLQYILELIDASDPLAHEFIEALDIPPLSVCRGTVCLWRIRIPSNAVIEKCIRSIESKKYKSLFVKLLSETEEQKIIRKSIECYCLVEIIDSNRDRTSNNSSYISSNSDCKNMNIIYSYVEIDKIHALTNSNHDLYFYYDIETCEYNIKHDPENTIRRLIKRLTNAEWTYSQCTRSIDHPDSGSRSNICIDMSIIILYICMIVSNCFGIDLLKMLNDSDLLNTKIRNRICKN